MYRQLKHGFTALRHRCYRTMHFEYWPMQVFYAPMVPVWLYYALKSRNPFYFTAVNPGIKNGGFFNNSKFDILKQLPAKWIPKTMLLKPGDHPDYSALSYPLVVKPDNGLRGKGVHIVGNKRELDLALSVEYPVLLQHYVDLPLEFGVFFYRDTRTGKPSISGVTGKHFLTVKGDGRSTVGELLRKMPRASGKLRHYKEKLLKDWQVVLQEGESRIVEQIGNHNRGTLFYDASELINMQMVDLFENIADKINGFNWGRFDIRVASINDLYSGDQLKILEVNGSQSEPTHLYDPGYNLLHAYRVVLKHFRLNYRFARSLVKQGISQYPSPRQFLTELRRHLQHSSRIQNKLKAQS